MVVVKGFQEHKFPLVAKFQEWSALNECFLGEYFYKAFSSSGCGKMLLHLVWKVARLFLLSSPSTTKTLSCLPSEPNRRLGSGGFGTQGELLGTELHSSLLVPCIRGSQGQGRGRGDLRAQPGRGQGCRAPLREGILFPGVALSWMTFSFLLWCLSCLPSDCKHFEDNLLGPASHLNQGLPA